jgi:hypothetical protein
MGCSSRREIQQALNFMMCVSYKTAEGGFHGIDRQPNIPLVLFVVRQAVFV